MTEIKTPDAPSVDEDVGQSELPTQLMEMPTNTTTLENSLKVYYDVEQRCTIKSSNLIPRCFSRRNENICSHRFGIKC